MARISVQSTTNRTQRILKIVLSSMPDGITEGEMSEALKLGRRTINNYLRELAAQGVIRKQGLLWHLTAESELDAIRNELVSVIDRLFEYLKMRRV